MIISLLLSVMMVAAIGAGLVLRRRAPVIGVPITIAAVAGLYFVWAPEHLSLVAIAIGVGRGADLVLYLWASISFLALAALLLELRHLQRQLTLLAREQALQRARLETLPGATDPAASADAVGPVGGDALETEP